MSYKFYEDFSFHDEVCKPYNISIEKNSDLEHLHSTVKNNEYHILVNGNKHFATTPPLKDLKMEMKMVVTPSLLFDDAREFHIPGFTVFLRYDRFTRRGYALEYLFEGKIFSAFCGFF